MDIMRDIHNLSTFKREASRLIKQVQQTKEPVILTVNGKAAVVVQDAESYQQMRDANERLETVAVLRERLAHSPQGRTDDEFFAALWAENGISEEG
jgi:prevent-host-death family protein